MHQLISKTSTLLLVGIVAFSMMPLKAQATLLTNYLLLEPGNSNDFVTLSDLLLEDPPGVMVGDKIFSEFLYSTVGNDMPDPQDINVFGFEDQEGNYGLSFHGTFWDLPGDGPSDALLRFTVDVSPEAQAEGWRISDAHLFMGGVGVDMPEVEVGENSVITVDESFEQNNHMLNTYLSSFGQGGEQLSDWVYFDQLYTSLRVTKDILAFANDDATLPSRTTVIDQSFSQKRIPEPSSAILMALVGIGLVVWVRQQRG